MQGLDRHRAGRSLRSLAGSVPRIAALLLTILPIVLGGCASIVIHERPILDRATVYPATGSAPDTSDAGALLAGRGGAGPEASRLGDHVLSRRGPEGPPGHPRRGGLGSSSRSRSPGGAGQLQAGHRVHAGERRIASPRSRTCHWTEVLARAGIGVQGRLSLYEAARWEEVLPTRRFEVKGFHHQAGQGGIGAPVVASLVRTGNWGEPVSDHPGGLTEPCKQYFPKTLYRAASAVLRPGSGPGEPPAVLELHDPVLDPEMRWQAASDGPGLPLAYDMTVPLARQFHVTNLNLLGAMAVLYPSEYTARTGIYMIDPYQPGKIPVVFVHGLMSSPEAWDNAINELRGDPELRKRYQFWMFFYSTGNPILASGARFRKALERPAHPARPGGERPGLRPDDADRPQHGRAAVAAVDLQQRPDPLEHRLQGPPRTGRDGARSSRTCSCRRCSSSRCPRSAGSSSSRRRIAAAPWATSSWAGWPRG